MVGLLCADAKPSEAKTVPEAILFLGENNMASSAVLRDRDANKWRTTTLWTEKV
jgi:hypothetical protein